MDLTWKGDGSYSEGKRAAELALFSRRRGTRRFSFTIFRPTVTEGPGDSSGRTWFWIQRAGDGGALLIPRTVPLAIFNHAYVEDVAQAFINSIDNPSSIDQAYNIAGRETLTEEDYVREIARLANHQSDPVSSPIEHVRRQSGLSGFKTPFMNERFVMSFGKAKRELGYEPVPLKERLKITVSWFLGQGGLPDSEGYAKRKLELDTARTLKSSRSLYAKFSKTEL